MSALEKPVAGSQPPSGYMAWHELAAAQSKAGLRQSYCSSCGKWLFPQEECAHDEPRMTETQFRRAARLAERAGR